MFPFPSDQNQADNNLEDRLRGLILRNDSPGALPHHQSPIRPPPGLPIPASAERQPPTSPTATRRRPNQAQRRQQSSQFSIPIDPRPTGQVPQTARFSQSPGFANSPWLASPQGQHDVHSPRSIGHNQQRYMQATGVGANIGLNASAAAAVTVGPNASYSGNMGIAPESPAHHGYNQHRQRDRNSFGEYSRSPGNSHMRYDSHNNRDGYRNQPNRQLFQPGSYNSNRNHSSVGPEELANQAAYLDGLANERVSTMVIPQAEVEEKEAFRALLEKACREAITDYELKKGNTSFQPESVQVRCFGSMASGFATTGSDMDLALVTPMSEPPVDSAQSEIPRILEKVLLDFGFGARLLTRTRVPIIKLCEKPTEQLRADLLESRRKWEEGLSGDGEEDDAEGDEPELPHDDAPPGQTTSDEEKYEARLSTLKQKPNQTINEHFGNAKRLLKKLAGRDLNVGYSDDISPEEYKVANDVGRAFVIGLNDQELSERILNYRSTSFDEPPNFNRLRSLNSLFQAIEGEKLAMKWSKRTLLEATEKQETDAHYVIQDWTSLQDSVVMDASAYNKDLHVALDRLRRISSLQLASLEQGQHEEPQVYFARVSRFLRDLGGDDRRGESPASQVVVAAYVKGISNTKIRDQLEAIVPLRSLRDISNRHKILHLVKQYEHGLSSGLFADEDRATVEEYIRQLTEAVLSPRQDSDSLQAVLPRFDPALTTKIRALPDPTATQKREKYSDHLTFPKSGVGIQCDINFSAQLALHNTQLLRCYSHSDPRVRPMILFVKHWAKLRGINTPYRGTLSSYGYVLMVLHYLVNVAVPFVCPNLQELRRPLPPNLPPAEVARLTECNGCDIQFWKNEEEIISLAMRGLLNHNTSSLGMLLRGFFEYYAQNGPMSTGSGRGFDWGREVLSLRTRGGIITKQEKGWVGARTVTETSAPAPTARRPSHSGAAQGDANKVEVKEIRHRYLFAIEDPFELDHNVARTVTHEGIVGIRDEFRRAWRIIRVAGKGHKMKDCVLDEPPAKGPAKSGLQGLMDAMHGLESEE